MQRTVSVCVFTLAVACTQSLEVADSGFDAGLLVAGGFDAGTLSDAGADAGTCCRFWDGGTCTIKTQCPCFSSDDCPPTHRCQSEDDTDTNVFCVPGARGTQGLGKPCASEADCQSALCVDTVTAGLTCSALCYATKECPAVLPRCIYVGFGVDRALCMPPAP